MPNKKRKAFGKHPVRELLVRKWSSPKAQLAGAAFVLAYGFTCLFLGGSIYFAQDWSKQLIFRWALLETILALFVIFRLTFTLRDLRNSGERDAWEVTGLTDKQIRRDLAVAIVRWLLPMIFGIYLVEWFVNNHVLIQVGSVRQSFDFHRNRYLWIWGTTIFPLVLCLNLLIFSFIMSLFGERLLGRRKFTMHDFTDALGSVVVTSFLSIVTTGYVLAFVHMYQQLTHPKIEAWKFAAKDYFSSFSTSMYSAFGAGDVIFKSVVLLLAPLLVKAVLLEALLWCSECTLRSLRSVSEGS